MSAYLHAPKGRSDRSAGLAVNANVLRGMLFARRRGFPWLLSAMSILVVAMVLSPLALIIVQSVQAGWSDVWSVLDRSFVVTVFSAVIGTGAAWLTERTALPGRRVWAVLLIVPIVIPDFVLAWTWSSMFPAVHGYFGAVLVMTLHLYPLVYLPIAAAFRAADPGQEEAARGQLSDWLTATGRRAAPATQHTYHATLCAFYRFAVKEGYLYRSPMEGIERCAPGYAVPEAAVMTEAGGEAGVGER